MIDDQKLAAANFVCESSGDSRTTELAAANSHFLLHVKRKKATPAAAILAVLPQHLPASWASTGARLLADLGEDRHG
ncbi:hypothetical protein [Mesorhizobium sp.]|uniref:hypothetical protein n=1 Tax=Mesorhizobium sp. TaxID=1871066 RepID=UPI0025C6F010|nr:hypothetical protein [Mesorhizobium sp.]